MGTVADVRTALIDAALPTGGGLDATPAQDVEVERLAAVLEHASAPVDVAAQRSLLAGRWKLLYGGFKLERETTLARLSFGKLPKIDIRITDVFQEVTADGEQYDNPVEFTFGDGLVGVQRTCGHFTVCESQSDRLEITFTGARFEPKDPFLDVRRWNAALGVHDRAEADVAVAFAGWSDVLYLDDELRLMRGNAGNLYVLWRER